MELLSVLKVSIAIYIILIVLAEIIIPFFRFQNKEVGVYKLLLVFSNIGFMGFPLISAICGNKALLIASIFLLPFNFLIYTYGIFQLVGKTENIGIIVKKVVNVGVIAVIITFTIALMQVQLPYILSQSILMLGNLSAPLCMMVIGASFNDISFRKMFCNVKLFIFCIIRLLIVPYILMQLVMSFTSDNILQKVIFVVVATPAGSMVSMIAHQYDGEYLVASEGVVISTLLSIVTMPVLFQILNF